MFFLIKGSKLSCHAQCCRSIFISLWQLVDAFFMIRPIKIKHISRGLAYVVQTADNHPVTSLGTTYYDIFSATPRSKVELHVRRLTCNLSRSKRVKLDRWIKRRTEFEQFRSTNTFHPSASDGLNTVESNVLLAYHELNSLSLVRLVQSSTFDLGQDSRLRTGVDQDLKQQLKEFVSALGLTKNCCCLTRCSQICYLRIPWSSGLFVPPTKGRTTLQTPPWTEKI